MSAERASLAALIDSVADGAAIDWDGLAAFATDEHAQRRLRNLRLVARLAAVHAGDTAVAADDPLQGEASDLRRGTPERWGHLVIVEKIGEGSFGEVYRARDPWLDREVALKLLRTPSGDASVLRNLLKEARSLARVRHRHVVTVYGADVHEGRVGIWMELLRGETLEARLASHGTLSEREAAAAGQELCLALAAVHAAGLVHRDVKASNVMREEGGRHVLTDFGGGELRDVAATPDSSAAGTPLYLAPEILAGAPATPQADLYAAGVLLYRLVTASYPVTADSIEGLRDAHDRGARARLRDARPESSEPFVNAVEKALDPDPGRRFATAGEMCEALARVTTPGTRWTPRRAALPLAAALVLAAGVWLGITSVWPPPAAGPHVVAVLPLLADASVSADFADGMTDAIIQELAALDTIRVMPYAAVVTFKDSGRGVADITALLTASQSGSRDGLSFVEGAIGRDGDRIRLNVRLIHAGSQTARWNKTFDRPMQDVARLQQEIAREVAGDLPVVINAASLKRWSRTQAIEPESYDRYLRGRTFLNRGSRESIERALDLFAEAVRLDPRNSYALAATAAAHAQLAGGRTATPAKTVHDARSAAKAALTIDPGSAEAHAVLAEMSFFADWDWDGAEADYRQALSLNPSLEYARERYSMFLASRGRLDQAVVEIEEAMRVNPASLRLAAARAGLLNYARRHEEAAAEYERVLAGDPEHVAANVGLGRLFNATGRFHEALAIYTRLHARDPGDSFVEGQLAQALAGLGQHEAARTIVERLERDSASGARFVQPGTIAYVHASLRDSDRAFSWLGRAVAERSPGVLWLKVDPRVDSLRNDPRFDGLLRDFGGR